MKKLQFSTDKSAKKVQNNYSLNIHYYSKTPIYRAPIYRKPLFTAAIFFPQMELYIMHIVNRKNPDLPRTPIYRGRFLSPKPAVNRGFTVVLSWPRKGRYLLLTGLFKIIIRGYK